MTIDEIMRSPHWYRFGPFGEPDVTDADALARWIEQVRNAAFLCGARHGQITTIEVKMLLPHISPTPSTNSPDVMEIDRG